MRQKMELQIEEISIEIKRQKAKSERLEFTEIQKDQKGILYRFEKEGVKASFFLEEKENLLAGSIWLELSNEAFRENDNLSLVTPVTIRIRPKQLPERMTAMYLHRDCWTRPAFIKGFEEMPDRTQALYLDYGKEYGFLLPMVGESFKTMACPGEDGELTLMMTAYMGGIRKVEEPVFLLTKGETIYQAVHGAFLEAAGEKGVPLKQGRKYPEMFDYLGWCSWDACYTDISEELVCQKARELTEKQVPVRWFLMDDGWLSVRKQRLYSLAPEKAKFPHGFKNMIEDIKKDSCIDWFGVWHAFGGYWGGIEPKSEAALAEAGHLFETTGQKLLPHPTPEKGYGFYRDWYEMLRAEGIDFVKVDGQSAVKNYYENNLPVCRAARGSHQALEGAASAYMGGRLINCMGMSMENIFGRPGSGLSRNSDDFVPDNEQGFSEHLLQNCYNAIYHDELYFCDWDMFWTFHKDAVKHGILRAVSGGPVYVSDRVGETKKEALLPLCYEDGQILRMDRTAMPAQDCVFMNPKEGGILKLSNIASCGMGMCGAIAAYNLGGEQAKARVKPEDIYDLEGEHFFLYDYLKQEGELLNRGEEKEVTLEKDGCGLYLLVPARQGKAILGLLDKYISFHGVEEVFYTGDTYTLLLYQKGTLGFYSEKEVENVMVNGLDCTNSLEKKGYFYRLELAGEGKQLVVIQ